MPNEPPEPLMIRVNDVERTAVPRPHRGKLIAAGAALLFLTPLAVTVTPERVFDAAPAVVTSTLIHLALVAGAVCVLAAFVEYIADTRLRATAPTLGEIGRLYALVEQTSLALDAIAEHMPECKKLAELRGQANAIRLGFLQATGTEPRAPRRPSGLRSVPRSTVED